MSMTSAGQLKPAGPAPHFIFEKGEADGTVDALAVILAAARRLA